MADSLETTGVGLTFTYDGNSGLGLLQSGSGSIEPGFTAEAQDEKGRTDDVTVGDHRATVDVTLYAYQGSSLPQKSGDTVTMGGFNNTKLNGDYIVTSVGEEHSQQDYKARNHSLTRYLDKAVGSATDAATTTTS